MKRLSSEFAGTYRLCMTPELLEFIERTFVAPNPPEAQAAIRSEALREAEGAEIELGEDGTFISRSQGQEFYRLSLPAALDDQGELSFQKPSGERLTLRFPDHNTVLAVQNGKPTTTFRRAQ